MDSDAASSGWRIEERRALLVLGLIAALATIRFGAGASWQVPVGTQKLDVIPIIDVMLGYWMLYEVFMVLGLSVWKDLQRHIIGFAQFIFFLGLIFIVIIGSVVFVFSYPPFSFYVTGLLLAWLIGQSAGSIRNAMRRMRSPRKDGFHITTESLAKLGAWGSGLILMLGLGPTKLLDPQLGLVVMITGICCVAYLSWKKLKAAE